ncbi:MAG: universal stress protein [Deltaproteobacteria bacterium]|nr:universal stress protein [Deltaproteobacteria bacterium]
MYRYKNLLVGLNNTDHDHNILAYAGLISRMAKSQKIVFVHALEKQERPRSLPQECSPVFEPGEALSKPRLEEMVKTHCDGYTEAEKVCAVIEGDPLAELLRLARKEDIDLILLGRKKAKEVRGKLATKLTRKAPCSVFVIPEGSEQKITNILVPVDFSDNSRDALQTAVTVATAAGLKNIFCQHVYHVPIGYHKSGKTYHEFAQIMKHNAMEEFHDFIHPIDLKGISLVPLYALNDLPAKAMIAAIKRRKVNLVVIGARGRSTGAFLLLGSVTERLIETTHVPLLAVKKKGPNLSFIDALLNL